MNAFGSKAQLVNVAVTFSKLSKSLRSIEKLHRERGEIRDVGKRKQPSQTQELTYIHTDDMGVKGLLGLKRREASQ